MSSLANAVDVFALCRYRIPTCRCRVSRHGDLLRSGIHVDYGALISSRVDVAEARSGLPVLRVYWYDSARHGIPDTVEEDRDDYRARKSLGDGPL